MSMFKNTDDTMGQKVIKIDIDGATEKAFPTKNISFIEENWTLKC